MQRKDVDVKMEFKRVTSEPPRRVMAAAPTSTAKRDQNVNWSYKPDGLQPQLKFGEFAQATIDLPSVAPGAHHLALRGNIGPYVALGINQGDLFREVWDIRSKEKIGEIKGLSLDNARTAKLRVDGKYFLAQPNGNQVLGLYDIVNGQPLGVISIDTPRAQYADFASGDRVFFIRNDVLNTWSLSPSLMEVKQKALPYLPSDNLFLTTPGGKYLVMASRRDETKSIVFVDLEFSNAAGKLDIGQGIDAVGAHLSSDGRTLHVLLTRATQLRLQTWDLAQGMLKSDERVPTSLETEVESPLAIESFPGSEKILLLDRLVFDPTSKKVTSELAESGDSTVIPLPKETVAIVQNGRLEQMSLTGRRTAQQSPAVTATNTPNPALLGTSGEKYDDSKLPPLTSIDRTKITTQEIDPEKSWSYIPRRPKFRWGKVTSRPVDIPGGTVYKACLSMAEWPYAAIAYSDQAFSPTDQVIDGHGEGNECWIEWFELRAGAKKDPFKLPFSTMLEDFSDDSQEVVTVIENGRDRVDIWNLKSEEHVRGFRPYATSQNPTGMPIRTAQFADGHLITSAEGICTIWSLPDLECVAEYRTGHMPPQLAPARDSILVTVPGENGIAFINADDGANAGVVTTEESVSAVAFSPDNESLLISTPTLTGSKIIVHDLTFNKEIDRFELPVAVQDIKWLEQDFALLNGTHLISLSNRAIVWNYELPVGMPVEERVDERYWYLVSDPNYALVGVKLPHVSASSALKTGKLKNTLLLSEGDSVLFESRINTELADGTQLNDVVGKLKQRLQDAGFSIGASSMQFILAAADHETEHTLQGELLVDLPTGLTAPQVRVPEKELLIQFALVTNGEIAWQQSVTAANLGEATFELTNRNPEGTVSEQLDRNMWGAGLEEVLRVQIPSTIFSEDALSGLGSSTFTSRGIE